MSAQVITPQETEKTTPVVAQPQSASPPQNNAAGANGGSNFAGISSSIFEFVDFLNELSTNEGLINSMNTMLRLSESQVEQATTKQEYVKQAKLQEMDAIKSAVGATVSLVSVGLEFKDAGPLSNAGTLRAKGDSLTNQLGELEDINKAATNKLNTLPEGERILGRDGDPALPSRAEPSKELQKMADGRQALVSETAAERDAKMNAIRNAGPEDTASIKDIMNKSNKEIERTIKQMETNSSQITSNNAKIRLGSEVFKGATDATIDARKAAITKNIGEIKATNQAATYSKQTLDQMQQSLTQQIKENADTLRSFLSGLAQAATRA